MSLKGFYYRKKKIILRMMTLVLTFIISVILPLYVYIDTFNLNLDPSVDISSYLDRLEASTLQIIIIGIMIMILLVISYKLDPISLYRLILSICIKVFYIIYIIIASGSEMFEIAIANSYLMVDLSVLNLFILFIPVLFIIRSVIKFVFEKKEVLCILIILEAILIRNLNSKIKIKKYILKNKEINQIIKRYLLRNFNNIIMTLENNYHYPLITKKNKGYAVTKEGQELLRHRGYKVIDEVQQVDNLQVWTESDLIKLANKRIKKSKKYIFS